MPFYQYNVKNNQGQTLVGTLQAANTDAARQALLSAGYLVQSVTGMPAVVKTPGRINPSIPLSKVSTATPVASGQSAHRFGVEAARVPTLNQPSASGPAPDSYKTKSGNDRDMFFLFSQLGSYFRSGINPAQSLTDLSARVPPIYRESLKHAAQVVSEGGRMSDVFEKYPYLYPPDVAGTIRAGEAAGFLPEAMDEIASKMELSYRLKRRLKYFNLMFISVVASTPAILGIVQGSLGSIAAQDAANGSLPVAGTLSSAIFTSMLHDLPATVLIFVALWGFYKWFHSMPMRGFRHRLVMRTPVLSGRAMAESMARLTWAMGMISRGGMNPQTTFNLAAQSVPNLAIRNRLEEEGGRMTESDKLSTALRRSALLPPEYGNIVETGEITGDVPRSLENVARATDADFQGRNATAVTSVSWILYGIMAVLILIIAAILLRHWYGGLITTLTGDS